jgi:hypothetical protein
MFVRIFGGPMELLEREPFFSMLGRIGLHVGLKIYFFRPMRLLNLVVFYIYIYREREKVK